MQKYTFVQAEQRQTEYRRNACLSRKGHALLSFLFEKGGKLQFYVDFRYKSQYAKTSRFPVNNKR